jgi:hypothetical protein
MWLKIPYARQSLQLSVLKDFTVTASWKIYFTAMTTIQSPGHLLSHLARKGDPSAFYTIVAPCAHATYTALRNTGKNHKETMSQVIPFLKKLYRGFPEKPHDIDFDSWYLSKQKKYLEAIPEPSRDDSEEIFLGQISGTDLLHLDSQMKLLFMRNYNRVREQERKIFRKSRFYSLWSNFFLRWAFIILFFLIAFAGSQVYLTLAHIQLTLSMDSKTVHRVVTIPSAINKRLFPGTMPQSPSLTTFHVNRSDTTPAPLLKADTINKAPVVKRRIVSQAVVQSPAFSTEQQKPAGVKMRQKNVEDSLGINPARSAEIAGRTMVLPDLKTKPAPEKSYPLPLPHKRLSSTADSSTVVP